MQKVKKLMRCDCCYRKREVTQYGELIVCEQCGKKVRKCPLCGHYYFDFEGMPLGADVLICYDCWLKEMENYVEL